VVQILDGPHNQAVEDRELIVVMIYVALHSLRPSEQTWTRPKVSRFMANGYGTKTNHPQ